MAQKINRRDEPDRTSNVTAADRERDKEIKRRRSAGEEAPNRKEERPTIDLRTEQPKEDGGGLVSTNIPGGSITGGATAQAERLLTDPKGEVKRIITGTVIGSGLGILGSYILGTTAVSQAATVGTTGTLITSQGGVIVGSGVTGYAVNTATIATTASLLAKIGLTLSATGLLIGTIGSYPFAGFIKEEALQTLGFGVRSAIENGDLEGAEIAIAMQEEILNPTLQDKLKNLIPYKNVLNQLKDFYTSARIKLAIDKEVINQMRIQQETGESEDEKWARIDEERKAAREQERLDDQAYYKQVAKDAAKAKSDARKEDQKYWNKVLQEREAYETAKRIADEKYWEDVRKRNSELKEAQNKAYAEYGKSQLSFGLL